jgi:hypothetical protein
MQEWWRRVLHVVSLLLVTLAVCAVGLIALDSSDVPLPAKMFRGLWNALNLVTTLGDFTGLAERDKVFMMATMVAFLAVGGYAVSSLTGILSSDAITAFRENKKMEHKLDDLANHVIVIGFGALGRLLAGRLHDTGEQVVVRIAKQKPSDLFACMGLGLSIARSIVEAHGGRIWAVHNLGAPGTAFHFVLPRI